MRDIKRIPIVKIKPNENNPRFIRDEKFEKLKKSIETFPEMLKARPIIINTDGLILGGNMRYRALRELGHTTAWVQEVDWDEQKQREFIIKDNLGYGAWDYDIVANLYEQEELEDWGFDTWISDDEPKPEEEAPKDMKPKFIECPNCGEHVELS